MPARKIIAIGGSDAGISAALRARELDPTREVMTVHTDTRATAIDTAGHRTWGTDYRRGTSLCVRSPGRIGAAASGRLPWRPSRT